PDSAPHRPAASTGAAAHSPPAAATPPAHRPPPDPDLIEGYASRLRGYGMRTLGASWLAGQRLRPARGRVSPGPPHWGNPCSPGPAVPPGPHPPTAPLGPPYD